MSEVLEDVKDSLRLIEDLKFFLATAPANWQENQVIRRYYLNNDEGFVSCVFWNNLYFMTGTDIVRCILYKFQHFGRTITDRKKFEEGIFSDLRNLKAGTDSVLEEPKLSFLEFLYKNSCLRTQKKQKVFYWFNVPHDKLMADALERDIKKERAGQLASSTAEREPALLFTYEDDSRSLYEQLCEHLAQPKYENVKLDDSSDTEPQDLESPAPMNARAGSGVKQETGDEEDFDDDFPLDYLDKGTGPPNGLWADHTGRDYIMLDNNYHSGAFINALDTDFENLDGAMFHNPINVISNDDYLIEQTIPARAPPSTSQIYFPRLAKFMEESAFFQQPQALQHGQSIPYPSSALIAPMAPYELGLHYEAPLAIYPHGAYEGEYYATGFTPIAPMMSFIEPVQTSYGYHDEFDYSSKFAGPSQRQQEISASMMRKRQQLQLVRNLRVSKPTRLGKPKQMDLDSKIRVQIKEEMSESLLNSEHAELEHQTGDNFE